MVDFGELKDKAENLAKEHADQVDDAIDKAAGLLGGKFGHAAQVEQGAEKLKAVLPGESDESGRAKAKPGAQHDGKGRAHGKGPGKAAEKAAGAASGKGAATGKVGGQHDGKRAQKRAP